MPTPDPAAIIADAEWLPHRYDAVSDTVNFRNVPRPRHRGRPFLTDEYLGEAGEIVPVPLAHAMAGAPPGRLHFIFHSAFCASTLLARACDAPGLAMGMSEPVILNDIVGIRRRGAEPKSVARMLDGAMRLLARPFAPEEAVVVKPSNIVNPLIPAMLAIRNDAKAVLLHAPLPVFLASVARKGIWCRLWARELLEGQLTDRVVDFGMTPQDHFRQTDLQVAAVGWLAQHALFTRLVEKFPDRIRTLDSETLVARPRETISALFEHFGLAVDDAAIDAVAHGPAFTRHSKFGGEFSAAARAAEQRSSSDAHADEIAKVTEWAEVIADAAHIGLVLPATLIG